MKELFIWAISPFWNFFNQIFAIFCITFVLSLILQFSGSEILRVQPLAIFTSFIFFLNIKWIFVTKNAFDELPWKIFFFLGSLMILGLVASWVSAGSERVESLGLFVGIMFTVPVTVGIGLLKDFDYFKRE